MPAAKKTLPPVDENISIPPAVRAAAAAADALHKQNYAQPEPEPAPPTAPASAEPAPVLEVTLKGNEPPAPPPTAPTPTDQDYEHRYLSMKGRHDRLDVANRELRERVSNMEQMIAAMAVTAPAPAPEPLQPPPSSITQAERETYGDEFIAMASKIANEQWAPKVAELESQLRNLGGRVENVGGYVAQTERQRMHAHLDAACPNWEEVNKNKDFLDWLALPDQYAGAIKQDLLTAAYTANDGPRVLAFFKGFLAEEAAKAPQPEPAPSPSALPTPKVSLTELAAPGRAKSAAAPNAPAEKPSFTRAFITQFYVDVSNKKYVGREDEKNRIERDISDAAREGRIG